MDSGFGLVVAAMATRLASSEAGHRWLLGGLDPHGGRGLER